jgi:hypothetical protein
MDIEGLINRHTRALELLEAIREVRSRHARRKQWAESYVGLFPQLRRKYANDLDTLERVERKLWGWYFNRNL